MEQKRPADIFQELLDYLWNGLGLEEKGWKRLKKGDFKKKMKNGLTYQIWFDRSRYNYIDYEIGHGNVEVGFSCMVKRILENERYLGMDGYPRLVTDEEFLAVRLRRREQNTYAPCPSEIIPIRNKAVCALCGEKMTRDTKSHGRPRWRCKNPECGGSVYLDDSIILERVMQKLKVLAHSPEHIQLPKAAPVSTDALRIENELALCFNRADINPEYMKTLIMAAAAERYAGLNDPTPTHKLELLRQKLELEPESEETLWEVFESAVAQVRIGKGGEISLHQKDQKECAL